MDKATKIEWPTVALFAACYGIWALATTWAVGALGVGPAILTAGLAIAFHASLTHEAVHGHPFASPVANAALAFPTLTLVIPYGRFRDTHMAHHQDADLTDPYDDPESNYLDPAIWVALPAWQRVILRFNNTLIGRLLVGPLVSQICFLRSDLRAHRNGDHRVLQGWLWHVPQAGVVLAWLLWVAQMPLWAYGLAVYLALSLLKIRTFAEHKADERAAGRTVVIEDKGPLALLFLNNNLHVVHHMHPGLPWYALPAKYRAAKARYLGINGGYVFRSYGDLFRRHLIRAKDPVPHPLYDGESGR